MNAQKHFGVWLKRSGKLMAILFPSRTRLVHAIDSRTGMLISGYPIFASSTALVGLPIVYQHSDATFWMLFVDDHGAFVHVRTNDPIVLHSVSASSGSCRTFTCPDLLLRHVLSLKPLKISEFTNLRSIDADTHFVMITKQGLYLLTFSISPSDQRDLSSPLKFHFPSSTATMNLYQPVSAYFVDATGKPTNHLLFDATPIKLIFQVRICPPLYPLTNNNGFLVHSYRSRAIDSFGQPLSEWSKVLIFRDTLKNGFACGHCQCYVNHLSLSDIPYSSSRNEIYLQLFDSVSGLVFQQGPNDVTTSATFELSAVNIHLVVGFIYLPLFYLYLGLLILYGLSNSLLNLHHRSHVRFSL